MNSSRVGSLKLSPDSTFNNNFYEHHFKKLMRTLKEEKPVDNLISILIFQANLSCKNQNFKHREAVQKILLQKTAFKMLVKLTPALV